MAGLLDFLTGGLLGGQAPQQQPPAPFQGGNDPFGAAFQNLAHGKTLIGGLADALQGATTGQRTDPVGMYQQMAGMTYKALLDAGVPEPQARLGATNPDVQKAITAKMFPQYAPHNIGQTTGAFNPATGQFTPQYQAPEFKTVAPGDTGISYQPPLAGAAPGPLGGPVQSAPLPPPPGAQGPTPLGQGAPGTTPVGRQPPAPVGQSGTQTVVPGMSIAEKEAQTKAGQAAGAVRATLPSIQQKTEQSLQVIDQLQNHPGKKWAIGALGKIPAVPGTPQGDFVIQLNQATSGLFRQAVQDMRGLGSLSDREGMKVETAIGRLDRAQTEQAFNSALNEVRQLLQQGWQNAQNIAQNKMEPYKSATPIPPPGTPGPAPPAPTPKGAIAPPVGFLHNGFRFKGGNPNDKANWEPAA